MKFYNCPPDGVTPEQLTRIRADVVRKMSDFSNASRGYDWDDVAVLRHMVQSAVTPISVVNWMEDALAMLSCGLVERKLEGMVSWPAESVSAQPTSTESPASIHRDQCMWIRRTSAVAEQFIREMLRADGLNLKLRPGDYLQRAYELAEAHVAEAQKRGDVEWQHQPVASLP